MNSDFYMVREGDLDLLETRLGPKGECQICISTRRGGQSFGNADLNLSIGTGDDDANVHANRERLGEYLDCKGDEIAGLGQIHGREILEVDTDNLKSFQGRKNRADGMITSLKGQWLSISIGDCQPIAIFDSRRQMLVMLHAGWGGTALRIAEEAVNRLKQQGSETEDLYAMLGPCIGGGVYQVDSRVFKEFSGSWDNWKDFVSDSSGEHGYIDINGANRSLLLANGLKRENIKEIELCTWSLPSLFFSHRRDGLPGGRMFALGRIRD